MFKKFTKADWVIWITISIAFACIITLCVIREKVVIPPAAPPPERGREVMKKPGSEDMPVLRHDPRPQDMPVIKKQGGNDSLKKED